MNRDGVNSSMAGSNPAGGGATPSPLAMSRNARWRKKNPDAYRAYMKAYMAKRRMGPKTK